MVHPVTAQLESDRLVKTWRGHAEDPCVSTTLSCGQCRAPLRVEQDWCSLCYAAVEAEFDPLTAPLDEVVGRLEPVTPAEADAAAEADPMEAVAGASADRVSTPLIDRASIDRASIGRGPATPVETADQEQSAEVSDLDVMFSMLAAEHRRSDPAAGIAERLQDRSTRIAVMVGGTALVGVVVFLVLTVLGALA